MVHSGGYYVVDRQTVPSALDLPLYWFRWDAAITWAMRIALVVQLYWLGGAHNLPSGQLSDGQAIVLSIAVLLVGTAIHDLVWSSPLRRRDTATAAGRYVALVARAWGSSIWSRAVASTSRSASSSAPS